MGIEKLQGQLLHLVEQVCPELRHGVLGHVYHDPGIAVGAQSAHTVDPRHNTEHSGKAGEIAGKNIVVDEGLDKIGACHGAGGADQPCEKRRREDCGSRNDKLPYAGVGNR